MKILIVEDVNVVRKRLEITLGDYGTCESVKDGHAALEAFRIALENKNPFDLVTLDISMPKMNGHETLKSLREIESEFELNENERVKILMVTANDDIDNLIQSFNESCNAYLVKPVTEDNVLKSLKELGLISGIADG